MRRRLPMFAQLIDALPVPPRHRELALQMARYAVVGGFVTVIGAGAYWLAVEYGGMSPPLGGFVAYVISVILGFFLHARVSFAGHGEGGREGRRSVRFVLVSLVSFALNESWIYLLTDVLDGATWWPIPAMIFVTPLVVFALNRKWVFA